MNASENATLAPIASFSADITEGKVPLTVQFTDTSSGEPTSWSWDFGDGTSSTLQNASHVYTGSGDYNVSLTVSNANGSDSIIKANYISVDTRPVVTIDYISPNPAIRGETVSLVGLYVYNHSAIATHEWRSDLMESRLCTGRTLYIGTLPVGNHAMSFRAMDSEGQWSEPVYGNLVILANSLPVATIESIAPNPAFKTEEITFIGTGTDPDGKNISDYQWRSSIDNFLSNRSGFSTSGLSVGTHTIYFKVKDHMSWSPEVSTMVTVDGNTQYLQAEFENAVSVNNPVGITVNLVNVRYVTAELSITDSSDVAVLSENLTEKLESGKYTFDWNATDQQGESLQSGAYTLNLVATDTYGNSISESLGMTVDNTDPVIYIDDISGTVVDGDVVYANSNLMVNISESGEEGDVATIDITLSSVSGSFTKTISANYENGLWLAEFDLSAVPDGNYTITALAMDTAKNSNSVHPDIVVNVDRTAPVIEEFTPSNGQVFAKDTTYVNVSFNYTDARTGINVSSIGLTVDDTDVTANATITGNSAWYNATGLVAGEHSASISVADNTGNEKTFTTKFWIGPKPSATTSSGSSSGSSSGGGGASTGEKYENIQVKEVQSIFVSKDSHVTYDFNKEGNAITGVQFDSLKNSGTISAIIEVLKDRSSFADTDAPGTVYQQMNIWVGKAGFVSPENVEDLFIDFKVERSWLEGNNIEIARVKLYRYSDGSWTALETLVTGEDDDYVYFESQTPGFSPFAISSETEATETSDEAVLQSVGDEGIDTGDVPGEARSASSNGSTIVFAVVGGISALLVGAFVLYRKRR